MTAQMRAAGELKGTDKFGTRRPLYVSVATDIEAHIRSGTLQVGERIPSVREIKARWQVSTSTALQALLWLESRGLAEARSRSGFFVRVPYADLVPEPGYEAQAPVRQAPVLDAVLGEILSASRDGRQLGAAVPTSDFFPITRLNRIARDILRRNPMHSCSYAFPPGDAELRRQIVRYAAPRQLGRASAEDIVITSGAMEALSLALRAVAKSGDVIAVESPTFFGTLQMIRALGMRTFEVATHPRLGIDIAVLERSIKNHRVKALITMSNSHNPLGYVLSDQRKSELADLAARYDLPIIEDDLFGDLAFEEPRPRTVKSYDRHGLVLLVSSYSKILGPGYRVGWIAAGRWKSKVEQLQFVNTVAASSLPQFITAQFLRSGGYERHLRQMRSALAHRMQMINRAVGMYFPPGTRVTRPAGGFLVWVQLPKPKSAMAVYRKALKQQITIIPGSMFSSAGRFDNCLRLSGGMPWSDAVRQSIAVLGALAHKS